MLYLSVKSLSINSLEWKRLDDCCLASNGRMHPNINTALAYIYTDTEDSQWNTPFTGRPESIAGWINYFPKGNDNLQIKVILHTRFAKQPDPEYTENWVVETALAFQIHQRFSQHKLQSPRKS